MSDELKRRTKSFALEIIKFVDLLPNNISGRNIAGQLFRSSTSVGANYRAACRARSDAEFYAKIRIVLEEIDECCYWLELIIEGKLSEHLIVRRLLKEANELTAIFVTTSKATSKKLSK